MFRFQYTEYLYLLGLLPFFILLFAGLSVWKKNRLKKAGTFRLVSAQLIGVIPGRLLFKFILLLLAFAALVIGYANLQRGAGSETMQRKGVDVIIALDVSKSMLANDILPNRLTRAKQLVMNMMDKMKHDRVGLIVFAGRAYLQVPLTIDYSAMSMMLQHAHPGLVPTQGTAIGDAVSLATQSFSQKEKKYKSLIIISDGEDHDENSMAAVDEAVKSGVVIHTIGIGSPEGATLLDPATGTYKLDEQGTPVVSRLNETALRTVASSGRGTYSLLRNTDDVAEKLVRELGNMEQKQLGSVVFGNFISYFQYFLAVAFLALLAEWLLAGTSFKTKTKPNTGIV